MNLNRCDDPLIPPLLSSAGWHLCIRLKGLWQNRQHLYPENAQTQTRKHTQVHSMHRVNICHMFGLTVVSAWHLFCRYVEQTGALWWITHDIKTTSSVDVYWCGNIQDRGFFFFFFFFLIFMTHSWAASSPLWLDTIMLMKPFPNQLYKNQSCLKSLRILKTV